MYNYVPLSKPSSMAAPLNALISLILLTSAHLSLSSTDIHDLLPTYNLRKGLLPLDIESYTLSDADNSFTIKLRSNPCYVTFGDQVVYYDTTIRGKLGQGRVSQVSGILAKKLCFWFSVTGIDVDEANDTIEFHVGSLSRKLPARDFDDVRSCEDKGLRGSFSFLEGLI